MARCIVSILALREKGDLDVLAILDRTGVSILALREKGDASLT